MMNIFGNCMYNETILNYVFIGIESLIESIDEGLLNISHGRAPYDMSVSDMLL